MKLSPSGESAMERVHSDALHEQKEMGWITQCAIRNVLRQRLPDLQACRVHKIT